MTLVGRARRLLPRRRVLVCVLLFEQGLVGVRSPVAFVTIVLRMR